MSEQQSFCILWVDLIGEIDNLLREVRAKLKCSIISSVPHLAYQTLQHSSPIALSHIILSYNDNVHINNLMEVANNLHKYRPNLDLFVFSVPLVPQPYNSPIYTTNANFPVQPPQVQPPQAINPSPQNFANNIPIPNQNFQTASNHNMSYLPPAAMNYSSNLGNNSNANYSTTAQALQFRTFGIWIQSLEALIDSLALSIPRRIEDNVVIWPKLGDKVSSDQSKMYYTIRSKLAEGSYAVVHRCTDFFNQEFVVKIQKTQQSKDRIEKNWKLEKKMLLNVNHPNVIQLYDAFIFNNLYYYVLEKADGTLRDRLDPNKNITFTLPEIVDLGSQVLSGLSHIHQKQIVHRDLQVDNILYKIEGNRIIYKISDFGISRKVSEKNQAVGTTGRGWEVAPELLKFGKTSYSSDIYQFGLILYHIITKRPVIEESDGDHSSAVVNGLPQQKASLLDSPLKYCLMKILEPDPNYRYQTAYEVYRDLQTFLGHY